MNVKADIRDDFPGRISIFAPYVVNEKVKAIPGARWDKDVRRWHCPISWTACLALRAEFGQSLIIGDGLKAWASPTGQLKAELRRLRYMIELPDGYEWAKTILAPYGLRGYQEVDAVYWFLSRQCGLLHETGTGKTWSALGGLKLIGLHDENTPVFPCCIIAPKSMLRVWRNEILSRFFPEAIVNVVDSTPAKNAKLMEPGADFYILSWGAIRKWSRHAPYGSVKINAEDKVDKELQKLGIQTFIGDEIHRARNCESMQTRAMWQTAWSAPNRIGLTGTLTESTCEDSYGALHALFPYDYPTKTSYMERYVEFEYDEYGGRVVKGYRADREDEFRQNFNACTRLITKEIAAPDLPPKVFETRFVTLSPKLRKVYNEMKKNYVATLTDGSVAATENQLTRANMLLRLANAELNLDPESDPEKPKYTYASSPKVEAFMTDLKEGDFGEAQIVVFAEFLGILDLAAEALDKAKYTWVRVDGSVTGDDRQKAIDTFQAGDARFFLLSKAGGEGITLTAASVMARLMRTWSFITHTQVEDRVHRIGSEIHESITIVDYVTEDTIEEAQVKRRIEKGAAATDTLRPDELLEMLQAEAS